MKYLTIVLIASLSGCAVVNGLREDFNSYKPIPLPEGIAKDSLIFIGKKYAASLGKRSASDSGADFLKYNDLIYKSINTVYSCDLVIADIRDSLFLNLRQCKILDVNPVSGETKWFDTKSDAPMSHRKAMTADFYYHYVDLNSPKKDSALSDQIIPMVLDEEGLKKYLNPRAGSQ